MIKFALFCLFWLLEVLFVSWYSMLMIGVIHLHILAAVNPIGYTTSLGFGTTLSLVFGCLYGWNRLWEWVNE